MHRRPGEPGQPRYEDMPMYAGGATLAPRGSLGCLGSLYIVLVLAIVAGLLQGPWLALAIAAMVLLVPLTVLAIRADLRREQATPPALDQESSLPPDAELGDDQRRDAMRRYAEEREDENA